MKKSIGIHEILELNRLLATQGFSYQVHLRDTCGAQACYIDTDIQPDPSFYEIIESYLKEKGFYPQYDKDKLNFILI